MPLRLAVSVARAVVILFLLVQAATAQGLPLRFEGDGAILMVNQLDLTERPDGLQVGKGKVQTETNARRISTRENEDGSARVVIGPNATWFR